MLWQPENDVARDTGTAVFASSPGLDPAQITIAVVMPTYKRPDHAVKTLASLKEQTLDAAFAVVTVENDAAECAGAQAAAAYLTQGGLNGVVIVESRQGNCNAYNAGFRTALDLFPNLTHLAIIDDDEVATSGWLGLLVAAARDSGADIVGGPQVPVFEDAEGARRFAMHPVFRSAHGQTGGAGLITSTGNCLIGVEVLRAMQPHFLDERFNFLGGGDTDFFTRCREKGFRFHWCQEAAVHETVPSRRTERSWITARSVRNGLISAIIQRKHSPGLAGRLKVIAKSVALLAASPVRSVVLAMRTGSLYAGSYHMMVAAGRLLAEFGYTIEQYRQPEKN